MFLATVVSLAGVSAQGRLTPDNAEDQDRRYNQLKAMMTFKNTDFDDLKFWTYGCNCLMLGDRPMSDPGLGPPVDELDKVCKRYKDCLKCAIISHGDDCINEFTRYRFTQKTSGKNEGVSF
jgi:hypothetical protein